MKRLFPSSARDQNNETHAGPKTTADARDQTRQSFAVARLVAIYVVLSGAWILLSDRLVATFVHDPATIHQVQTYKGWFFVAVTGALLGWLVRRDLRRIENAAVTVRESEERLRVALGAANEGLEETKRMEEELRQANEKSTEALNYNRTILDASPVGLITCKATGEVVSANEGAARVIGATREQVRAQKFQQLEWWQHHGLQVVADKALATGQEQEHEAIMTTALGKRVWLSLRFVPFRYSGELHLLVVVNDVTAQKDAQEARRRATETLEAIVNSSPAAIFNIGPDGRIQSLWNPAAEKMFGWQREEAMGRTLPILPDHTMSEFAALRQRVLSGVSFSGIEVRRWRRDATPIDISLAAAPSTDSTGRVTGIVAVAIDITERKRAEAALQESETKFRTLVEQSLTGVYIIQEGRFVYVNPGLCRIYGYSAGDMLEMDPLDTVHEDDRERVAGKLEQWLKGEVKSLHYSFGGRHKDGRRLEVEVLGSRTEFNGRPAVIGTALDVTARKLAEEQQRRLAAEKDHLIERLQLHYNAMPIGCIVTAPDLTVRDWNPAAVRIFGFTQDEMAGRQPYGRIISEQSRELVQKFVADLLLGNETRSLVHENETKDGRRIFCEWHDTPLRDESGQVVGLLTMVQDVTERLQSEAALRELSGRLLAAQDEERRRIARELHDTTAQQLVALSLNLAAISRLLPNPPPKAERILAESLKLVGTAAQEVRTTAYLLHPPLLEAAGLVGAVRDYASGFAKRSGIQVGLELEEELARLPQEAELALFRVVQEGLANIHRHSGSLTATIRLAREAGFVKLQIKDTGHGIPTQTHAALLSKPGAVGVGIAGMRERLHQLKGRLEIGSGPNGTTISATLPVGMAKPET